MPQFELTPKALANLSPGLERSDNPGAIIYRLVTLKRVRQLPNPFRVDELFLISTQGSHYAVHYHDILYRSLS